ncbi:MAG: hypothetical protein VCD00_00375 [Candidatus Hydrogenedentota bacterium]
MKPQRFLSGRSTLGAACALLLALQFSVGAWAKEFTPIYTEAELALMTPTTADPAIAWLPPGTEPDYDFWRSAHYWQRMNKVTDFSSRAFVEFNEQEPNDLPSQAQPIPLGTGQFQNPEVLINAAFETLTFIQTFVHEDNGSIPLAVKTGLGTKQVTATLSRIGDGPHGSTGSQQGDFDYYEVGTPFTPIPKGVFIEVDIDTFDNGATLDSFVIIWNAFGSVVAFADDDTRNGSLDSFISYRVEQEGVYYVSVSAWHPEFWGGGPGPLTNNFPESPFLSGSGAGIASEGDYNITIRVSDVDYVQVQLQAGDVLGISSVGKNTPVAGIRLENLFGTELVAQGSNSDLDVFYSENASAYYPSGSPLDSDGDLHASYVIGESGTYRIAFMGSAPIGYQMDLRAYRPGLEEDNSKQGIFVTFGTVQQIYDPDTEEITTFIGGPIEFNPSVYNIPDLGLIYNDNDLLISSMAVFLDPLGLPVGNDDELLSSYFALLSGIFQVIGNHFPNDIELRVGPPPEPGDILYEARFEDFAEILVGGKIEETGIFTVGLSQTIDPGNYLTSEQAFVLLDIISEEAPLIPFFSITGAGDEIDAQRRFQAQVKMYSTIIGNIVAHEAGHFLGAFHTNNANQTWELMDAGSSFSQIAGVGPDGIFNTFDDDQFTYGIDEYQPGELFTGFEDTEAVVFWGVNAFSAPDINFDNVYVDYLRVNNGAGTKEQPFNSTEDAVTVLNSGGTINIFPGAGNDTFSDANRLDTPMVIRNENPQGGVVRIGGN